MRSGYDGYFQALRSIIVSGRRDVDRGGVIECCRRWNIALAGGDAPLKRATAQDTDRHMDGHLPSRLKFRQLQVTKTAYCRHSSMPFLGLHREVVVD